MVTGQELDCTCRGLKEILVVLCKGLEQGSMVDISICHCPSSMFQPFITDQVSLQLLDSIRGIRERTGHYSVNFYIFFICNCFYMQ